MTALESPACLALGLICSVNHLPASSPNPVWQMKIWLPKQLGTFAISLSLIMFLSACFTEPLLTLMLLLILDWLNLLYRLRFDSNHWQLRQIMSCIFFRLGMIGPRGFLAPLGVVSTSTFVWVVVRFALSCEIQSAAGNKLYLMFTLLSGGQSLGSSNCSEDYSDYKLQVSDNIRGKHDVQQVRMTNLLTTFSSVLCCLWVVCVSWQSR